MLTLRRRLGKSIYIGDELLTVDNFSDEILSVTFRGRTHHILQGKVYSLTDEIKVCYNHREAGCAVFQMEAPAKILREEIYGNEPKQRK